jgi:hypothetical protein
VHRPGTTVPIPNDTHSLRPGEKVVKYSTTDEKPIIVIAPSPPKPQQQQQQQQYGKLRCCFRIHCCIQTRSNTEILCNYVSEVMSSVLISNNYSASNVVSCLQRYLSRLQSELNLEIPEMTVR